MILLGLPFSTHDIPDKINMYGRKHFQLLFPEWGYKKKNSWTCIIYTEFKLKPLLYFADLRFHLNLELTMLKYEFRVV